MCFKRSHPQKANYYIDIYCIVFLYLQAVRAAQDEQIRLKDVEINELKSLRMDLDRELRDTRTVSDRVRSLTYII